MGGDGVDLVIPAGHLMRTKLARDLELLLEIANDRGVEGFVVGIPYGQDGDGRRAGVDPVGRSESDVGTRPRRFRGWG